MTNKRFGDYKDKRHKKITFFENQFYPDIIEGATALYEPVFREFADILAESDTSAALLENIVRRPNCVQLLRIFRRYVSPDTSVEMLKVKRNIPIIIAEYGSKFRPIELVKEYYSRMPIPDVVLSSIFYESAIRGEKGYLLTEAFFNWFRAKFDGSFLLEGPERAGKDINLKKRLPGFEYKTPADFLITDPHGNPLVVGFARYDSDRGGSQEDDRIKGNRDNVTTILEYRKQQGVPVRVLFLNDGPGLTLGSMWDDYSYLETYGDVYGADLVRVVTLKMLDKRVTKEWIYGR